MDLVPDILAGPNEKPLFPLRHRGGKKIRLYTLLVAWSTSGAIDGGRAHNGRFYGSRVALAGPKDDFVDVAVDGIRRQIDQLAYTLPIIILFGPLNAILTSALILDR